MPASLWRPPCGRRSPRRNARPYAATPNRPCALASRSRPRTLRTSRPNGGANREPEIPRSQLDCKPSHAPSQAGYRRGTCRRAYPKWGCPRRLRNTGALTPQSARCREGGQFNWHAVVHCSAPLSLGDSNSFNVGSWSPTTPRPSSGPAAESGTPPPRNWTASDPSLPSLGS